MLSDASSSVLLVVVIKPVTPVWAAKFAALVSIPTGALQSIPPVTAAAVVQY
jgi:hypothetical protein